MPRIAHQPPTDHSTEQLFSHHGSYLGTLFCATNNSEAKPCLLSNQSDQRFYPFYTRSCRVNTHSWSKTQPSQIPRISTNINHEILVSTLQTITGACQLALCSQCGLATLWTYIHTKSQLGEKFLLQYTLLTSICIEISEHCHIEHN